MDTFWLIVALTISAAASLVFWLRLLHNDGRARRKPRYVEIPDNTEDPS